MKKLRALDRRILRNWLPLAFVATAVIGLIYVVSQNNLRSSANDPQIQIAEDAAAALAGGASAQNLATAQQNDITTSLATFATIFDGNKKVIVTSGKISSADPVLPDGVFEHTKKHGQDRFTWEPKPGVRVAAVVEAYQTKDGKQGYVLVGRNLREIEARESQLLILSAATWGITMLGSLALRIKLTPKK